MEILPANVQVYKRTPEFNEHSIPAGLLENHCTKAGVWGRIVVRSGQLEYFILADSPEYWLLDANHAGIAAPQQLHYVRPKGAVSFCVEFLR